MKDSASFWDGIADRYAKRPVQDQLAYDQTLDRTRSYLTATDQVMELGAGTGTTALLLADAVGHITGTDHAARMVQIATAKARDRRVDNVTFHQAPADNTTAPAAALDVVMAFNLLHLVPDVGAVARAAHRQLKPGGAFITKTICLGEGGLMYRLLLPPMQWIGKAPYVGFLTIAMLEQTITDAGFKIIETGNYPAKPPSRFIVARKP